MPRPSSEEAKRRILSTCVQLFIQKGYHNTTVAEILKEAKVSNSTFQNIFRAKDGVLLALAEFMFDSQFAAARHVNQPGRCPAYLYAVETAIQLAVTEMNENIRDVYVEAYTNPETADYLIERTSEKVYEIFAPYNPERSPSDFYELDIGTSGLMRSFMSHPCNVYFTLERKITRFLRMSLMLYHVPEIDIEECVTRVLELDIRAISDRIMNKLFEALCMHFALSPENVPEKERMDA